MGQCFHSIRIIFQHARSSSLPIRLYLELILTIFVALLNASFANAQSGRERPLQDVFRTDLVYSQDRGEIQFTTGPGMVWNHGRRLLQFPTQAEYGLTDSWQLQFDWDGWQRQTKRDNPR